MLNYIWAFMIIIGIIIAAFTGQMDAVSSGILDSSKEAISLCILMLGVVGMWTGVMKIAEQTGLVRQLTKLLMPVLRLLFPKIAEEEEVMGYIAANMIANLLGLGWAATPTGIKAMKALKEIHIRRCEKESKAVIDRVDGDRKSDRKEQYIGDQNHSRGAQSVGDRNHNRGAQSVGDRNLSRGKLSGGDIRSKKGTGNSKIDISAASDEMCMLMVMNISSLQLIPINMIAYRMQYGSVHPGAILLPGLIATGVSTLVGVGYGYLKCRKHRKG